MPHVVLLGDSIFDNAAYVPGEPDVVAQLRAILPPGWRATLCAIDGSMTRDVERQLRSVPTDASQFVISSGGNDALGSVDILESPAGSVADALGQLAYLSERFEADYSVMLDKVRARGLPTAVCTIYNGNFDDPLMRRLARTALMVFNDVIVRQASRFGIPLIDLRTVCAVPEDYANPIEPSAVGGLKIAHAIARLIRGHDFQGRTASIYV
jgi:hypothetical protein